MNLTYQKVQFLAATIGPGTIATYTDKDNKKKLILKEQGVELLGGAEASYGKSYTDNFMKKAVLLTQTKNAPSDPINVDFGFRVVAEFKTPAYIDNSEYWPKAKPYGGVYPNLSTYGDTQAIAMDNEIIDMIIADKGFNNTTPTNPSKAIVNARRGYTVIDTLNTDASGFTITWPDGTSTVFATATTFADGQLAEQLMADTTAAYGSTVGALLEAYQIAANTYIITSRVEGLKFELGTPVDSTISTAGILLDSKIDDINFRVEFDTYEWSAQELNITKLSSSDSFVAASNAHVSVDGTITEITAGTDQDTVKAAFSGVTGVTALADGANALTLATPLSVKSMAVNFPVLNKAGNDPLTASNLSITYEATTKGKFSVMNADDVQRVFAAMDHAGHLRSAIRGAQVTVEGEEYTMFTLTGINKVGAIDAASHSSDSSVTLQLYVPTEATRGNKWDASDNATGLDVPSGTPDLTIEELLQYWSS